MKHLNFSRKALTFMPQLSFSMQAALTLDLSYNELTRVDGSMIAHVLPRLMGVDLSHTLISKLEDVVPLRALTQLTELDIRNTPLAMGYSRLALLQVLLFPIEFFDAVQQQCRRDAAASPDGLDQDAGTAVAANRLPKIIDGTFGVAVHNKQMVQLKFNATKYNFVPSLNLASIRASETDTAGPSLPSHRSTARSSGSVTVRSSLGVAAEESGSRSARAMTVADVHLKVLAAGSSRFSEIHTQREQRSSRAISSSTPRSQMVGDQLPRVLPVPRPPPSSARGHSVVVRRGGASFRGIGRVEAGRGAGRQHAASARESIASDIRAEIGDDDSREVPLAFTSRRFVPPLALDGDTGLLAAAAISGQQKTLPGVPAAMREGATKLPGGVIARRRRNAVSLDGSQRPERAKSNIVPFEITDLVLRDEDGTVASRAGRSPFFPALEVFNGLIVTKDELEECYKSAVIDYAAARANEGARALYDASYSRRRAKRAVSAVDSEAAESPLPPDDENNENVRPASSRVGRPTSRATASRASTGVPGADSSADRPGSENKDEAAVVMVGGTRPGSSAVAVPRLNLRQMQEGQAEQQQQQHQQHQHQPGDEDAEATRLLTNLALASARRTGQMGSFGLVPTPASFSVQSFRSPSRSGRESSASARAAATDRGTKVRIPVSVMQEHRQTPQPPQKQDPKSSSSSSSNSNSNSNSNSKGPTATDSAIRSPQLSTRAHAMTYRFRPHLTYDDVCNALAPYNIPLHVVLEQQHKVNKAMASKALAARQASVASVMPKKSTGQEMLEATDMELTRREMLERIRNSEKESTERLDAQLRNFLSAAGEREKTEKANARLASHQERLRLIQKGNYVQATSLREKEQDELEKERLQHLGMKPYQPSFRTRVALSRTGKSGTLSSHQTLNRQKKVEDRIQQRVNGDGIVFGREADGDARPTAADPAVVAAEG